MLHITSSILDFPHPGLSPEIWDKDGKLQSQHKEVILSTLTQLLEEAGLSHSDDWIDAISIIGSITTYQYVSTSDIDIHIFTDLDKFIKLERPTFSQKEAATYLDNLRGLWNKTMGPLPGTKHQLETYFDTPFATNPSNRITGIYNITTDTWEKPPVAVSIDFDITEMKPFLVDMANTLAEDMDVSLGNIKRHVERIEELQEVLAAWPKDKREIFQKKIDERIASIDAEISDLLTLREKVVQDRKTYKPESQQEINFKYLQRFGYLFLIGQFKDLLEQVKEVTEETIPDVKEIVSEASLVKTANQVAYWVDPEGTAHSVTSTHEQWANASAIELKRDRGITINQRDPVRSLLEAGWVRALIDNDDGAMLLTVSQLSNIPDTINDFVLEHWNRGLDGILIEDLHGKYKNLPPPDDMVRRRRGFIELEAGYDNYWIKSDGSVMPIKDNDHNEWARVNIDWLEGKAPPTANGVSDQMFKMGWTRAIVSSEAIFIQNELNGIPDYIDVFIWDHWQDKPGFSVIYNNPKSGGDKQVVDVSEGLEKGLRKYRPVAKKAQKGVEYDYSSTHVCLPKHIAAKIIEWGQKNIPDEHVYTDETERYGRETDSHVTVKYGLLTNDGVEVKKHFAQHKPVKLKFGKTRFFSPPTGLHDVVVIDVSSKDLEDLNKSVEASFEADDLYPTYEPHVTIAYVLPGHGKHYQGQDVFEEDIELVLSEVVFAPKEGEDVICPLGECEKKASWQLSDIALWVAPDGTRYDVRTSGQDYTHSSWVQDNKNLLKKKYHITVQPRDTYATEKEMFHRGWVRLGDMSNGIGFEVGSLKKIPSFVDDLIAEYLGFAESIFMASSDSERMLEIDNPFPSIQNAVNKQLFMGKMSSEKKSNLDYKMWLSPSGEEFPLEGDDIHVTWFRYNADVLQRHGIDTTKFMQYYEEGLQDNMDDEEQKILHQMYDKGWVRVTTDEYEGEGNLGIGIRNLHQLPAWMDNFLQEKGVNQEIYFDDGQVSVPIQYPPNTDIQKAVNQALLVSKAADFSPSIATSPADNDWSFSEGGPNVEIPTEPQNISDEETYYAPHADKPRPKSFWDRFIALITGTKKTAAYNHAYWIDPAGEVYTVREATGSETTPSTTHTRWILDNLKLLHEKYNYPENSVAGTDELIRKGWTRIGDGWASDWGITAYDLKNLNPAIDSVLAQFAPEGARIVVQGLSRWSDSVTIEWPVKSVQSAVMQALNRMRMQPATVAQMERFFKEAPKEDQIEVQALLDSGHHKEAFILVEKVIGIEADSEAHKILQLAQDFGGATYNLEKGNIAGQKLYAVATHPDRAVILDHPPTVEDIDGYLTSNRDILNAETSLGVWINGTKTYLDIVSTIPDRAEAIELGKKFNQISIFDLSNLQEIPTGGTGEVAKKAEMIEMDSPDGLSFPILVNPTHSEALGLLEKSQERQLRYTYDTDGSYYIWDAYYGTHFEVIKALHEMGIPIDETAPGEFVMGERDLSVFASRWKDKENEPFTPLPVTVDMKTDDKNLGQPGVRRFMGKPDGEYHSNEGEVDDILIKNVEKEDKEASSNILRVEPYGGGTEIPIYVNPAKQVSLNLLRKHPEGLRVIDGDNAIYVWDAHQATHDHILDFLSANGYEEYSTVQTGYIMNPSDLGEFNWKFSSLQLSSRDKKAYSSIGTNKFWISPKGKTIQIGQSEMHVDWIAHNLAWLAKNGVDVEDLSQPLAFYKGKYFDDLGEDQQVLEIIMNNMQLNGWTRISTDDVRTQFVVDAGKMGFGPGVDDFVAQYFDPNVGKPIGAFWKGGSYLEIDDPFPTLAQAYQKASKSPAAKKWHKSQLTAAGPIFLWLAPNGFAFQVTEGSHDSWMLSNKQMLEKNYGIQIDNRDDQDKVSWLISKGWVRVTGYLPTEIDLNVADINNVPQSAERFVWKHNPETVIVEDLAGNNDSFDHAEYSSGLLRKTEKLQPEAGNESTCYTDEQMEEIYDKQHSEDGLKDDPGGGNVYHDWNQDTSQFPKKPGPYKVRLDILQKPVDRRYPPQDTPPYDVPFYEGMPAEDDGPM